MTETIAQAFDASVDYYDGWMRVALPNYAGIFAAALEQIELNRRRDNAQFGNALASFAVRTEDELLQTKQNVEQLLSHTRTDSLVPNEFENSNNNN